MSLCPHCQNPLPDAPERFCPHCGSILEVEAEAPPAPPPPPAWDPVTLVAELPPPPGSEPPPAAGSTPWERRAEIGFLTALVETTQQVLTHPTDFFRALSPTGGIGSPLLYGVIIGFVGVLASALYQAILQAVVGPMAFSNAPAEQLLGTLNTGMGFVAQVIFGPIALIIFLFLSAGVMHLLLMLFGGANRDFEATLRVRCYSEAAAVFNIIPFCGALLQLVALAILLVVGLSEVHGIGKGKAAAAVLTPAVLVCCCCGALVFFFASAIMAAVGAAQP